MASSPPPNGQPEGVVAIGASAGGVEALTRLAGGLPSDLPFPVLVVLARRLAQTAGSGSAYRRYNEVAEEAEQAMPVLGKRLMESSADGGNPDGG